MPMKTYQEQRKYQRAWYMARRREWFEQNGPCRGCGTWNDLQVDHVDPSVKVSHRIWSWSTARREAELAKCQPLCWRCHVRKHWGDAAAATKVRPRMYVPASGPINAIACIRCGTQFRAVRGYTVYCDSCGAKRRRRAS